MAKEKLPVTLRPGHNMGHPRKSVAIKQKQESIFNGDSAIERGYNPPKKKGQLKEVKQVDREVNNSPAHKTAREALRKSFAEVRGKYYK